MALLESRQVPNLTQVLPSSLIDQIHSHAELSTLYSYVNQSTKLFNLFNQSQEFTFLAPTNDAFSTWLANQTTTPTLDVVEATMEYHLLQGSFLTLDSFTNETVYQPSYLSNTSYSNVTIPPAGQRVGLRTDLSGNPEFVSSNFSVTPIVEKDVLCLGGIMQFVSSILTIPTALVTLTQQANLSYFIALLNKAQFLSINDAGLIDFVNLASFTPNLTFFVPNSAEALAAFNAFPTNISADELLAKFNYHIVPDFVGYSSNLTNGTSLKTLQGDNLTITRDGNNIFVNAARITTPDYLVVNGVIQVIDTLLDRFNQSIPAEIPRASSNMTTTSSSSGLSTGSKVAIGVVVPVVVLAALAGLLFWFFRRRKPARAAELGTESSRPEMGQSSEPKELGSGAQEGREMDATEPKRELDGTSPRQELASPFQQQHRPYELE